MTAFSDADVVRVLNRSDGPVHPTRAFRERLYAELEAVLEATDITPARSPTPELTLLPSSDDERRPRSRWPAILAAAAILVVLATTVTITSSRQPDRQIAVSPGLTELDELCRTHVTTLNDAVTRYDSRNPTGIMQTTAADLSQLITPLSSFATAAFTIARNAPAGEPFTDSLQRSITALDNAAVTLSSGQSDSVTIASNDVAVARLSLAGALRNASENGAPTCGLIRL